MATASTKSRARKRQERAAEVDEAGDGQEINAGVRDPDLPVIGAELSQRAWFIACGVILLVAAVLRCYELDVKPLHHDEGVNGFFLSSLIRSGAYRYDPSNYHGPTLYYFSVPLAYAADKLGHLSTTIIRLVPALFGIALVWLVFSLRRQLGMIGALGAGALLAVSPGAVFFSRYYIHEMLFVFFTLGIVVAAVKFYESQTGPASGDASKLGAAGAAAFSLVLATLGAVYRPEFFKLETFLIGSSLTLLVALLWAGDGPRAWHWLLMWAAAALLFATKETAFISIGVLLIAWAMAWGYVTLKEKFNQAGEGNRQSNKKKRRQPSVVPSGAQSSPGMMSELSRRVGGWQRLSVLLIAGLCIFLFLNIVFFSSFFTNPKGVRDALAAYAIWQNTGTSDFHRKPFDIYLKWLFQKESPLLILGALGALLAVWRPRGRFPLFAALWAWGIVAAYSLVPYKTPWLALSMIVPLALAAGHALQTFYRRNALRGDALAYALVPLALAVAVHLYQTYTINFIHYDEDSYVYVYAHTSREFDRMMEEVGRLAARTGAQHNASINVASPDYWPMPWYVRDYKRVGYAGQLGASATEDIVIINTTQEAKARAALGSRYQRIGDTYKLRPGVDLILYARSELAQ